MMKARLSRKMLHSVHCTPHMESTEGGKRYRNYTINYRELAGMQKRSRD
jgi:hypothetical protein